FLAQPPGLLVGDGHRLRPPTGNAFLLDEVSRDGGVIHPGGTDGIQPGEPLVPAPAGAVAERVVADPGVVRGLARCFPVRFAHGIPSRLLGCGRRAAESRARPAPGLRPPGTVATKTAPRKLVGRSRRAGPRVSVRHDASDSWRPARWNERARDL